ncbi:MAG TPA: PQQ-binding-like beta-propeller repeat protein [Acidimicrobiales bacterium]|nr:PQQ-binding-like beta-propeller repeat protein [Acidimicrobiales bacterium]
MPTQSTVSSRSLRALAAAAGMAAFGLVASAPASAQAISVKLVWSQTLSDAGLPIGLSSPNVATLDGQPSVVVGDRKGFVYAFTLDKGAAVTGWPYDTSGVPVDSTPSVAQLPGESDDTVFVGLGDSATPHAGGYLAINSDGTKRWAVTVQNPSSDGQGNIAVPASLAVGDLQGASLDVVAPSVGQEEYAMDASSGAVLPGFPWFTADSVFTTPALADVYQSGQTDIVEGGDQTPGMSYGVLYLKGGHMRVISPTGTLGTNSPTGGLLCESNPDQGIESSPAVGHFLAGGGIGIVAGTSQTWPGAATTDKLIAFSPSCGTVWEASLDGLTTSSPALADLQGDGSLDVVEGTNAGAGHGSVYALDGATGAVLWHQSVGEIIGGVVTADLGEGYQDVIAPTVNGAYILDGKSGQVLAQMAPSLGMESSPLVTDDPNGTVGITLAGHDGHNAGQVDHYEIAGSDGTKVDVPGAWPMFHHDPQLTGNAGVSLARATALQRRCAAPLGSPEGYYELSRDGHVYRFGNLASCGDIASKGLRSIGIAATADGGGYWVATANQIFSFGDAVPVRAHVSGVVAIAATPDGKGLWAVSAGGKVWAVGDAKVYHGPSAHGPVVAIASSASGHGYLLVNPNGVVSAYGDAKARSSVGPHDVTGIATDWDTGGYWLVTATGMVYSYAAGSFGSVPASASEHAVVGIASGHGGYRLVDGGGGLFCFGTAAALGTDRPAQPMMALAVP